MKRLVLCAVCLFAVTFAGAQKHSLVEVYAEDGFETTITLNKVVNGAPVPVASWSFNDYCGFSFDPPYEGFYSLGIEGNLVIFPLYLKPGDNASFIVDENGLRLKGKNTPENTKLYEWEDMTSYVKNSALNFMRGNVTYEEFFPAVESLVSEMDAFKNSVKTKNPKFDGLMKLYADRSVEFYAIHFLFTPRSKHPREADYTPFYHTIVDPAKVSTDEILQLPFGNKFVGVYPRLRLTPFDGTFPTLEEDLELFPNGRLKGEYAIQGAGRFKMYNEYLDLKKQLTGVITDEQMQRLDDIGAKLYVPEDGNDAADFTYPDIDGNNVSLSDFKGKVVLVDVWATWCGPCKQEIPHLKKLEEEMRGTDLVVISVSVDEEKDREKWKKMIEDEELGGIQLFANGWSKITKDYNITGIPRFMVFNKLGRVVAADSPRPSNPQLKKLLESELAK